MHYSLRINLGMIPKGLYVYSKIQSIVKGMHLFWCFEDMEIFVK